MPKHVDFIGQWCLSLYFELSLDLFIQFLILLFIGDDKPN